MEIDEQMSLINEEDEKKETKIKLSPGDQAMIDYMDKPIDRESVNRLAELTKAYLEELERKKEAQQEK